MQDGEGVGDGRAEGLSAAGGRGQAAVSLTPAMGGCLTSTSLKVRNLKVRV